MKKEVPKPRPAPTNSEVSRPRNPPPDEPLLEAAGAEDVGGGVEVVDNRLLKSRTAAHLPIMLQDSRSLISG